MAGRTETHSSTLNLSSLREQFRGRRFGELVLLQWKSLDLKTIVKAMQGTLEMCPLRSIEAEQWLDDIGANGRDPSFWRQDCGDALQNISDRARHKLAECGVCASDERLFNLFQIAVLNFAYGAHKYPQSRAFIQKSIGIGFLRRMFS